MCYLFVREEPHQELEKNFLPLNIFLLLLHMLPLYYLKEHHHRFNYSIQLVTFINKGKVFLRLNHHFMFKNIESPVLFETLTNPLLLKSEKQSESFGWTQMLYGFKICTPLGLCFNIKKRSFLFENQNYCKRTQPYV
jgi:hypothetical protein